MTCDAWLSLPTNDSSVSILILPRMYDSILVQILSRNGCLCTILDKFCVWPFFQPLWVFLGRVGWCVLVVQTFAVFGIVYEWPIEPHLLRIIFNVHYRLLFCWCRQWTYPLMLLWMWPLRLRVMILQGDPLSGVHSPPGVGSYVVSWDPPRSISASLIVVYSAGAGVVPKYKHSNRKASLSTTTMKVYAVIEFAWIWREAASRSIFLIKTRF